MAFLDSGILGGSLKVGGASPLDGKAKWEGTFVNLQSSVPLDQCWEGMVVYVTDDKKHYKLTTKGVTSATNVWTEFGAGATPTLQEVLEEGNVTDQSITIDSGLNSIELSEDGTITATANITGSALAIRNDDGELGTITGENLTDTREHQLQDKDGVLAHVDDIETAGFASRTGTEIAFDKWATYDSYGSPSDGNFSYDLTNAVVGMIQVAYHEDTVVPTFSQAGITPMITGEYQPNVVNKIAFELIALDRILINIKAL